MKLTINSRNGKIQLFFFLLMPCLVTYAALVWTIINLCVYQTDPPIAIIAISIIYSILGGFICAANTFSLSGLGPPQKPVLKITIGANKISAATSAEYSSGQQATFFLNLILSVIFAIPIMLMGWMLFILYCKGLFLKKAYMMGVELDEVDTILYLQKGGSLEDIAYYFYRMLDYFEVYRKLGEKGGARKMLSKAEQLLKLWEKLYPTT